MDFEKKYRKYKQKFMKLKGGASFHRPIILTDDGELAVNNWLRGVRGYETDFKPHHFETCYADIDHETRDTRQLYDIIFLSTGDRPYPELCLLERLYQKNIRVSNAFFYDPMYEDMETARSMRDIMRISTTQNCVFVGNISKLSELLNESNITLVIGFNLQIAFMDKTITEMRKKSEKFFDFLFNLKSTIPGVISFSFVSTDGDRLIRNRGFIEELIDGYVR